MKIAIISLLLFVLTGVAQEPNTPTGVDLNEQFKIKNGEEVLVTGEKLRIKFKSVSGDSRCPEGVACGWAGNGAMVIEVARKKKKQVVAVLNTTLEPKEVVYKQYKIKLVKLDPYPVYNVPVDPKNYEATLIVVKE